ncbi:uncharacterized protein LOC126151026 [Schistocerca cancellata]|uniref:uncharacterized protein LOC126151026 n=1 Tax=Schistocerca cancellata TaxID=274614 RepID=UPI0021181637|nr:uncharacterized protein LOC126151026 [Schistocerca cancellata]
MQPARATRLSRATFQHTAVREGGRGRRRSPVAGGPCRSAAAADAALATDGARHVAMRRRTPQRRHAAMRPLPLPLLLLLPLPLLLLPLAAEGTVRPLPGRRMNNFLCGERPQGASTMADPGVSNKAGAARLSTAHGVLAGTRAAFLHFVAPFLPLV